MTNWPPPVDGEPTYPGNESYPPPPPYPYQYPPPGYGYGWPPGQPRRPGPLTAAAVLGYVNAGLIMLAAILLFAGASVVTDVDAASGIGREPLTTEFTLDGLLNLIAAGLLIAGGVTMTNRRASGRVLYSVGAGIVLAETVYWIVRWTSLIDHFAGILVYGLIFAALAIVGLSLAWIREGTQWLRVNPR